MAKNRPGSILYALGMTQHTTGVQGIRSFTILQLLLGNMRQAGRRRQRAARRAQRAGRVTTWRVLYNYMPGYHQLGVQTPRPTIHDYVRKNGIADSRYYSQHAQSVLR